MDRPSEENLICMALGKADGIDALSFDLDSRILTIDHQGDPTTLLDILSPLRLGAQLRESSKLKGAAGPTQSFFDTTLSIPKMDCPSEQKMIRMALSDIGAIDSLKFDLTNRQLHVTHAGKVHAFIDKLLPLGLGTSLLESKPLPGRTQSAPDPAGDASEARTLRLLLAINALMFVVEMTWGLIAQSLALSQTRWTFLPKPPGMALPCTPSVGLRP